MNLRDLAASKRERRHKNDRREATHPRWRVVQSRLLDGEQILLVAHRRYLKEARQAHPDKVIYLPPEGEELQCHQNSPQYREVVRKIHLVKKEFDGWIEPSNSLL
jgi:hypothetical protein